MNLMKYVRYKENDAVRFGTTGGPKELKRLNKNKHKITDRSNIVTLKSPWGFLTIVVPEAFEAH